MEKNFVLLDLLVFFQERIKLPERYILLKFVQEQIRRLEFVCKIYSFIQSSRKIALLANMSFSRPFFPHNRSLSFQVSTL